MTELTANNFIQQINSMSKREMEKMSAMDLIELILLLPDVSSPELTTLNDKVNQLVNSISEIQMRSINNSAEILQLKEVNSTLTSSNADLLRENNRQSEEVIDSKVQVESIDIYLRVNNLEISGLPDIMIEVLHKLNPETEITPSNIDICHILPSRRRPDQHTHVVKFLCRISKENILFKCKKRNDNRNFKFCEKNIFINEHLIPAFKHLFALAKEKR